MDLSENTEIESIFHPEINKDFPYLPHLGQEADLLIYMAIKSLPHQN